MSSKIIAIVIGVVVLIGAGYMMYTNKANTLDDAAGGTSLAGSEDAGRNDTPDTTMGGAFRGSLFDLAARGGNYQCTFSSAADGTQSSGTVYVSGNMVRGNFKSVSSGTMMESHMITRDGYVYTWSPAMSTGMKLMMQGSGTGTTGTQGNYADANQQYDYDCDSWNLDASQFELPSGVQFMQFGQ